MQTISKKRVKEKSIKQSNSGRVFLSNIISSFRHTSSFITDAFTLTLEQRNSADKIAAVHRRSCQ